MVKCVQCTEHSVANVCYRKVIGDTLCVLQTHTMQKIQKCKQTNASKKPIKTYSAFIVGFGQFKMFETMTAIY